MDWLKEGDMKRTRSRPTPILFLSVIFLYQQWSNLFGLCRGNLTRLLLATTLNVTRHLLKWHCVLLQESDRYLLHLHPHPRWIFWFISFCVHVMHSGFGPSYLQNLRVRLVHMFKNWKLLFKNICGNTCG